MLLKLLVGLLFVLYPVIVYYGLTTNMAWLGLLILIAVFTYKALFVKQSRGFSALFVGLLLAGLLLQQQLTVKLIPLVIHVSLFLLFYQSLQSKRPLIERFAKLDFEVLPEGMVKHCRQITQVWALFFFTNVLLNIGLSLWATDEAWALYNGLIVYFLIGGLVVGEYVLRRFRFPDIIMPSFRDTAMKIAKNSKDIFGKTNE